MTYKDENLARDLRDVLDRFQKINSARCNRNFDALHSKPGYYYTNALAGEAGEACNDTRKLEDIRETLKPEQQCTAELELKCNLRHEIGDMMTYLALLSSRYNFSLAECLIEKFNIVSDKKDCDIKI